MSSLNKLGNQHLMIWSYINEIRGKGKTSLLKKGIDDYDKSFHLLTVNKEMGKNITKNKKCNIVTLNSLDNLRGSDKPLIIDQEAIAQLSFDTAKYLKDHSEVLDHIMSVSEQYQSAYHEYVRLTLEYMSTEWWQFKKRNNLKLQLLTYKDIDLFPKKEQEPQINVI
jgi:hypothetical protein